MSSTGFTDIPQEIKAQILQYTLPHSFDLAEESDKKTAQEFFKELRIWKLICEDTHECASDDDVIKNNVLYMNEAVKTQEKATKNFQRGPCKYEEYFEVVLPLKEKCLQLWNCTTPPFHIPKHITILFFIISPLSLTAVSLNVLTPLFILLFTFSYFYLLHPLICRFLESGWRNMRISSFIAPTSLLFFLKQLFSSLNMPLITQTYAPILPYVTAFVPYAIGLFIAVPTLLIIISYLFLVNKSYLASLNPMFHTHKIRKYFGFLLTFGTMFSTFSLHQMAIFPLLILSSIRPIVCSLFPLIIAIVICTKLEKKYPTASLILRFAIVTLITLISLSMFFVLPLFAQLGLVASYTLHPISGVTIFLKGFFAVISLYDTYVSRKFNSLKAIPSELAISSFIKWKNSNPSQIRQLLEKSMPLARAKMEQLKIDLKKDNDLKLNKEHLSWLRKIYYLYHFDSPTNFPLIQLKNFMNYLNTSKSLRVNRLLKNHYNLPNWPKKQSNREIIFEVLDKYAPVNQATSSPA